MSIVMLCWVSDARREQETPLSVKKKEPKPKLFGPDIFGWGGGLPREGVGAEKFGMSLETRETKLFRRDIPGFCRDIPEVPEKFEKKKFVFNFRSLFCASFWVLICRCVYHDRLLAQTTHLLRDVCWCRLASD